MPIRIFVCSSGDMIAERFGIPQYDLGECWMSGELFDDPILRCIRTALLAIYRDRIERLVLFGSRARSDAHADSGYDVAVFLENLTDRWREFHRLQTSETTFWRRRAPSRRRGRSGRAPTATAHR